MFTKKAKDLVNKAIKAYTDLLEGSPVTIDGTTLSVDIEGRSLFSIIRYTPSCLKDENSLQYIFYQVGF